MLGTLMVTALLMGLAGSPHCIAMCGAACAAASGRASCGRGRTPPAAPLAWLMAGRLAGYALAGALVAASVGLLGGWAERTAWVRPLWAMGQVGALALGVWLLWRGRQPAWLEQLGRRAAASTSAEGWHPVRGPMRQGGIGMAWALLPCGLLQSALVVAALAGDAVGGAAVMAAFAIGSGLVLVLGPIAWSWLTSGPAGRLFGPRGGAAALEARWPIRIAGGMLALAAFWALWHGFGVASGLCQPLV